MGALSIVSSDSECGDVPLITPQKAVILGATNVMARWTTHLIMLLASGLVAMIISITVIVTYLLTSTSALNSTRHIILVDATERVTPERACVAESVVRLHGDVPCYLYLTSSPTPLLKQLADAYPNLYLRRWYWTPNIKETPMEPLLNSMGVVWFNLIGSSSESQELTARALTLWKYGGTSLSLDWEVKEGAGCLGEEEAPYDQVDAHATAFLRLEKCHVLMEKLLVEIKSELERGWNLDAGNMFTKVLRKVCARRKEMREEPELCHGIKVYNGTLPCAAPLPIDWYNCENGNCPLTKAGNFKLEYLNNEVA